MTLFQSALRLPAIPLLMAIAGAAPLHGWGCEGHQIVALLARAHLTPAASDAIDRLLRENRVEVTSPFCKGGGDLMADVSSWADAVRNTEKTGPWHYIDIPLAAHEGDVAQWCPPIGELAAGKDRPGCVLNAIDLNMRVLSDAAEPGPERARALRYLIHFVGDMHQPLHTTDNNDHGGNCTSLEIPGEPAPFNLHSIWDVKLLTRELAEEHSDVAHYATKLDARFGEEWRALAQGNPTAWAWEGHGIAEKMTYGDLQPGIPVETPNPGASCDAERSKVAALRIRIDDRYFHDAIPVIDQQLARAGYRLSGLLNQALR